MTAPHLLEPEISAATASPCAAHVSLDRAHHIMRGLVRPLACETVPIAEAGGRVLARPICARLDSPRADVAAMDGFAVSAASLANGLRVFDIVSATYAGDCAAAPIDPASACRIMTGAPVPPGADRVIPFELTQERGGRLFVDQDLPDRTHIRGRASDFHAGQPLLDAGVLLDPARLIVAAASDRPDAEVHRRPRLTLIASGDELAAPGRAAARAMGVPESLTDALMLFARSWGTEPCGKAVVGDEPRRIEEAIGQAAASADVVVLVGGAARGERDFARPSATARGVRISFAGVAMKPGKPVWYGQLGETHVLGLPGNPAAALVVARLFLAPLLCGLSGRGFDTALAWRDAPAAQALPQGGDRETFFFARQEGGRVEIIERQSASAQLPLARAELIARRGVQAPPLAAGALLHVLDL